MTAILDLREREINQITQHRKTEAIPKQVLCIGVHEVHADGAWF
jgi:hypothetical protein